EESYGAIFSGGIARAISGAIVTAWHIASFPFAVVRARARVVQVHSSDYYAFWESALYMYMARLLRRRVAMRFGGSFSSFHDRSGPLARRLIRAILARPDAIIVQSEAWRRFFETIAPASRLRVVPNGVRAAEPPPERAPRREGLRALCI